MYTASSHDVRSMHVAELAGFICEMGSRGGGNEWFWSEMAQLHQANTAQLVSDAKALISTRLDELLRHDLAL